MRGGTIVLFHAYAGVVQRPQVALALGIFHLRRLFIQGHGLVQVLFRSLSVFIAHAQVAYGGGIVHVGALPKEGECLFLVRLHPGAAVVAHSLPVQAHGVIRRRLAEPVKCLLRVPLHAAGAVEIVHAHLHSGGAVAAVGGLSALLQVLLALAVCVCQLQQLRGKDHHIGLPGVLLVVGILLCHGKTLLARARDAMQDAPFFGILSHPAPTCNAQSPGRVSFSPRPRSRQTRRQTAGRRRWPHPGSFPPPRSPPA